MIYSHERRSRGAISEIVATLIMILVVVSIGATIFAFATNGFGALGNSFANLSSNSSNQISENVVVEQVAFTNTGLSSTSGLTLYLMNAGINPSTIAAVYVQNVTANAFVKQFKSGTNLPGIINSGSVQAVEVTGLIPDHGTVYAITIATSLGTTVIYYAKYN